MQLGWGSALPTNLRASLSFHASGRCCGRENGALLVFVYFERLVLFEESVNLQCMIHRDSYRARGHCHQEELRYAS